MEAEKRRPFRGRLHLRQVRHRHDDGGNIGPTGEPLPKPDVLLLSYTGCFTFMKWFELLRQKYNCETRHAARALPGRRQDPAEHARLHGQAAQGERDPEARAGLRRQVRHRPAARIHARVGQGRGRSGLGAAVGQEPALADRRLFRRRLLHRPDLHRLPRHAEARSTTTACCARRSRSGCAEGKGPVTPDGDMGKEKYRLVVEGPPNWTNFREFWKMFYDEGAVVVAVDLHQGRRRLRFRLPPRSRPAAGVARRLLPRLLHQPATCRSAST